MQPLKTYLVEDSAVIREDLAAALHELTALQIVGSAAGEATAIAWLSQAGREVDLVIVDLFLKSGSGLGLLRARAGAWRHTACRVVVLTNYATADMRRHCLSLGADRVFDKSCEIDALIDDCRQLAAERSVGRPGARPAEVVP